jgi:hypothetical protein
MNLDAIEQAAIMARAEGRTCVLDATALVELCRQLRGARHALDMVHRHAPPPTCTLSQYVADTVRHALSD